MHSEGAVLHGEASYDVYPVHHDGFRSVKAVDQVPDACCLAVHCFCASFALLCLLAVRCGALRCGACWLVSFFAVRSVALIAFALLLLFLARAGRVGCLFGLVWPCLVLFGLVWTK